MEQRVNIEQILPEALKALYGLAVILNKSMLSPIQKHLIKVRVSQLTHVHSVSICTLKNL